MPKFADNTLVLPHAAGVSITLRWLCHLVYTVYYSDIPLIWAYHWLLLIVYNIPDFALRCWTQS